MQAILQNVPIEAIFANEKSEARWINFPEYQRERVWSLRDRQRLIDSLLRGLIVPPLHCYQEGNKYYIYDGRQRIEAIRDYIRGVFKTGRAAPGEEASGLFYPNKLFSQLPEESRNQILSYGLMFLISQDATEDERRANFRSIQHGKPLRSADKLWSYVSQVAEAAKLLSTHDFFSTIYKGSTLYREPYQQALYVLAIEMSRGFLELNSEGLKKIAGGKYDELYTPAFLDQSIDRLSKVSLLFYGAETRAINGVVIMVQSAWLLERAGFDVIRSDTGCLTEWFGKLESSQYKHSYESPFTQIIKRRFQETFWSKELPALVSSRLAGSSEANKQLERFCTWMRDRHICPACKKDGISLDSIALHGFHHTDRAWIVGCGDQVEVRRVPAAMAG